MVQWSKQTLFVTLIAARDITRLDVKLLLTDVRYWLLTDIGGSV